MDLEATFMINFEKGGSHIRYVAWNKCYATFDSDTVRIVDLSFNLTIKTSFPLHEQDVGLGRSVT